MLRTAFGIFVTTACITAWMLLTWWVVRTPEGDPYNWTLPAGAALGLSIWLAARASWRKGASRNIERTPAEKSHGFHEDVVGCGIPVDDVLDHWQGRHIQPMPKMPIAVAPPPPCVNKRRVFYLDPNPRPRPRWVRVYGRGLIYEVIGPGSRKGWLKVWGPLPGHAMEEYDEQILQTAYPKQGELWSQGKCEPCFARGGEEVLFMADGAPSTHARVACGCLTPLNLGLGPGTR